MNAAEQRVWLAAFAVGFHYEFYGAPEKRERDSKRHAARYGAYVAASAVEGLRSLPAEELPEWLRRER